MWCQGGDAARVLPEDMLMGMWKLAGEACRRVHTMQSGAQPGTPSDGHSGATRERSAPMAQPLRWTFHSWRVQPVDELPLLQPYHTAWPNLRTECMKQYCMRHGP